MGAWYVHSTFAATAGYDSAWAILNLTANGTIVTHYTGSR